MPGLVKDVSERIDVVVTLTNKRLREMLCYYFNHLTSGIFQMKKDLMLDTIKKYIEEVSTNYISNQQEKIK